MRNLFFMLILSTVFGCAGTHRGRAVQLVVASDAAADEVSSGYEAFVDAKISYCDDRLDPNIHTKEDARGCLGVASSDDGKRLQKVMETLVAAQLVIKIAVECESNPLKVPKEFQDQCIQGKKSDWQALAMNLSSAWRQLAPFFEAVRGFAGGK